VRHLASPELEGRLCGSQGYNEAAQYVGDYFKSIGLKDIAEDSYFQHLLVEYNQIDAPINFALMDNKSIVKKYELGKHYVCRGFTGSGNFTAPVVFCGYGVSSPQQGYDDYAGIDVREKVVLIFKPAPRWKINDSDFNEFGWPRVKTKIAADFGAIGVLFVSHPKDWQTDIIGSVYHGPGDHLGNFPQLHIDMAVADEILAITGENLINLQRSIDSTKTPASRDLKINVNIEVHARYTREKDTQNVIGFLEGSDPELKNELIIVGAHLDHVGQQAGLIYFPGANDNASGVACVMTLAKAFALSSVKPKRSILFITFASEEQGLYGATFYAENPLLPLEKTIAMLNLDCVGIGDSIRVNGGKDFPGLFSTVQSHKDSFQLLSNKSGSGGGADANPFHQGNIPNLYFVTTNGYQHLHQTSDTVDTLNGELLEQVARLAYLTIRDLANDGFVNKSD